MSTTYPVPGSEREYPAPRRPSLRVRVVPNESLAHWWSYLGELVQTLVNEGSEQGISVELDTSDRTRPGEMRGGASPLPIVALVILEGLSAAIADQLIGAAVAWAHRHLSRDAGTDDGVLVMLYGPNGEVLRSIRVPQGEGGAPPVDETDRLQR